MYTARGCVCSSDLLACQVKKHQGLKRVQQNRSLQLCYTCLETEAWAVEVGAAQDLGLIRGCQAAGAYQLQV